MVLRSFLCSAKSAIVHDDRAEASPVIRSSEKQEELLPSYSSSGDEQILHTMECYLDDISSELRELSLQIHDHPELGWDTIKAHDACVDFMRKKQAWTVTPHAYGLKAGWEAKFHHKKGGRTIGFNSEMDALPDVGHACGHNLIAIGGIGAALATAAALIKHDIPGSIILLGTPYEEGGGGKVVMLKAGAYKSMDTCFMIHPGPMNYAGTGPMIAISSATVEFFGKGAHAAGAPWEGINALDAAVHAYNGVAMLRQQCPQTTRIHAIIQMKPDQPINIIPDYCKATFAFRSATYADLEDLRQKLVHIWEAARLATGAKVKITWQFVRCLYCDDHIRIEVLICIDLSQTYKDVRHNPALADAYADYMQQKQKITLHDNLPSLGSTDFGDITYALPSIHPIFGIPTEGPRSGNHTIGFTKASRTMEAHKETLKATKGLAATALRFCTDENFAKSVKDTFVKA